MHLKFDYDIYKEELFTFWAVGVPIFAIGATVLFAIFFPIWVILFYVAFFCIALLPPCILILKKYGYAFRKNADVDVVMGEGVIENIKRWSYSPAILRSRNYFENIEAKLKRYYFFVFINGEKYVFREIGDFEVGHKVEFRYMTKVNVVLEVWQKEETEKEENTQTNNPATD